MFANVVNVHHVCDEINTDAGQSQKYFLHSYAKQLPCLLHCTGDYEQRTVTTTCQRRHTIQRGPKMAECSV